EAGHLAQIHRARVDPVHRGYGVPADTNGVEPGIGEGLTEWPELATRLVLSLGIREGPTIRGIEPRCEHALEIGDVALAEGAAKVPGSRHRVAGQDADAKGQRRIDACTLDFAVLGGSIPALDGLEPDVGVAEVRPRPSGDEITHHGRDALDEIRRGGGGHWGLRTQRGWKGSTHTVSPTLTSPRSSSMTMKQLAAVIEVRMPEPCGPVVRTSHRSLAQDRMPRLNSRRPVFLVNGSAAV